MKQPSIYQVSHITKVLFYLSVTSFFLIVAIYGGIEITSKFIGFALLLSILITDSGEFLLRVFGLADLEAWLPASFVIGWVWVSTVIFVPTYFFQIRIEYTFLLSALFLLISYSFKRRLNNKKIVIDKDDVIITILITIIIICLARIPISSSMYLEKTGILPIWTDYFIHGSTISSFGSPFSFNGDMELAGESRIFYHYLPFMLPALFQAISGASGLTIATSILLPLGLLVAAFGFYTFGVQLAGRLIGLFALATVVALPANLMLIQSGWFDFYWLLLISPGAGYGIGAATVVCACVLTYLKTNQSRVLYVVILLSASIILIRVHIFILLAPALFFLLIVHHLQSGRQKLLLLLLFIFVLFFAALHNSSYLHAFWFRFADPLGYLNFALNGLLFHGSAVKISSLPFGDTLLIQLTVSLIAILGVYFFLYPSLLWMKYRRYGFSLIDALPLLLIGTFLCLVLLAPKASNGDLTEYKHRHFLFLYVVVVIFSVAYLFEISDRVFNSSENKHYMYGVVAIIFLLTGILNWHSNPARPDVESMEWAKNFHGQPVSRGLLKVSQFIRLNSTPGDVLAMQSDFVKDSLHSEVIELTSLTGLPAYLSRIETKMRRSKCLQDLVTKRIGLLQSFAEISDPHIARIFMNDIGIRWLVVSAQDLPKWDRAGKYARFSTKDFLLYDFGHQNSLKFNTPQCTSFFE
jgi:hypothetical protein